MRICACVLTWVFDTQVWELGTEVPPTGPKLPAVTEEPGRPSGVHSVHLQALQLLKKV